MFAAGAPLLNAVAAHDGTIAALAPGIVAGWAFLRAALIVVALIVAVSSAEDFLLDLSYWIYMLGWPIRWWRQPSSKTIRASPERLAAIIIPAWQESGVIGRMLRNTVEGLEYDRFHIFVGAYPNDPQTCREVEALCAEFSNIHCIVGDNPGPTKKSDCLNQLVRGILKFEAEAGQKFDLFVNHDAEDVVHAFELKLANWYIAANAMVQLPVFSLDRGVWQFIACHYMDEFAEWHTKDLVIRSALTGMTPSAGVGTAFSRAAIDALLQSRDNQIFNPDSLTEDYDIAQFLFRLGFRSQFVRYHALMPFAHRTAILKRAVTRTRREIVATREYFPHEFRAAVRQKARWMLGICLQGWQQIGWQGGWIDRYFLWRDRKQLFTAPTVALAYAIFLAAALIYLASRTLPGFPALPPLAERQWVWDVIVLNLAFMFNRLAHRAIFVWRVHGLRYVPLSPLRAVVGNAIGFFAFLRAMRQFLVSLLTGRTVTWDKTVHAFPTLPVSARAPIARRKRGDARASQEQKLEPAAQPEEKKLQRRD